MSFLTQEGQRLQSEAYAASPIEPAGLGPVVNALIYFFSIVALIITGLRIYVRLSGEQSWGWDDVLAAIGYVSQPLLFTYLPTGNCMSLSCSLNLPISSFSSPPISLESCPRITGLVLLTLWSTPSSRFEQSSTLCTTNYCTLHRPALPRSRSP